MAKYLVIAGHGPRKNGSFDPGATGHITKGEYRYMKENLFPAMKKYANKDFIFYDKRNVFSYGDIVRLARSYGKNIAVIEMHFDASGSAQASGGHVIVYSHYKPDKMDLRLRDAIESMVGVRYNHYGQKGISGRSNLANVNRTASGGVNYRLVELGFGTNKRDADVLMNQTDAYAKKLVEAIQNSGATPSVSEPIKPSEPANKSIKQMAEEVEAGLHGNGHSNRQASLGVNSATYEKVRTEVNRRAGSYAPKPSTPKKSLATLAQEVIDGKWGNNPKRAEDLRKAGHNPDAVQAEVNKRLSGGGSKPAKKSIGQGSTVTARRLYASSSSTKNVRSTPIKGYVDTINTGWRNEIRLRNKKGGYYIGFTRRQDLV